MSYHLCGNIIMYRVSLLIYLSRAAGFSIDASHLPWSVYDYEWDEVTGERLVEPKCHGLPIPWRDMSYAFPYPYHLHFLLYILLAQSNTVSLSKNQPTIAEHEDLVWLAGNLKLEVIKCSRQLYGPVGMPKV